MGNTTAQTSHQHTIHMRVVRLFSGVTIVLAVSCTLEITDEDSFTMTRSDSQGDTVLAYRNISWAFSRPVEGDTIELEVTPDPGAFFSRLNNANDTLTMQINTILPGNTTFTIKPVGIISSEDGELLYPDEATFTVHTHAAEQEDNDSPEAADTFATPICGFLSSSHDTDYFYIADTTIAGIYLYSHDDGKRCGLAIQDSHGNREFVTSNAGKTAYYTFPSTLIKPLFVIVFWAEGAGRYELGNPALANE